jgi:methionyl-tRNA formyltransferase
MKKTSKTVVFFGSGPVAAKSLSLLLNDFSVELVITKPRAPHHKGPVPVLELAASKNIPTLTASNKHELDQLITANSFNSSLAILIDFGIIVSQKVIDAFELGIVNSHFSLLPKLRGADPITFAILNGDTKTGVSLMLIDEGMDTGKLLTQKTYHLPNTITTPELTDELIALSHQLLCEYLPPYMDGKLQPRQQPHTDRATYTRKLTKADGVIDWNKPAIQIEREIRAFQGWPGSRTSLFGKDVTITKAHAVPSDGTRGEVEIIKDTGELIVYAKTGYLCIEELKPAGKKEMPAKAFLSGLRLV